MDIQHLIDEVAKEHHVILSADDPIFISVTLNEHILRQYIENIDISLQKHLDATHELLNKSIDVAKEISANLITQTSVYLSENAKISMLKTQDDILSFINQEFLRLSALNKSCEKIKKNTMYFACFSIASMMLSLFSLLMHLIIH